MMTKDQEKEKKLLPCPFCGGEAEIVSSEFGIHVKCKNEKCWNIDYHSEQQAIKAWNTRHTEPTPSKPGHCPTCGTPVKVVGKTTMHYEPVGRQTQTGYLRSLGRSLVNTKQNILVARKAANLYFGHMLCMTRLNSFSVKSQGVSDGKQVET